MHQTHLNLVIPHKRQRFPALMFQEMSDMYDENLVKWHPFGILNFQTCPPT
jgi:hypothetical protein